MSHTFTCFSSDIKPSFWPYFQWECFVSGIWGPRLPLSARTSCLGFLVVPWFLPWGIWWNATFSIYFLEALSKQHNPFVAFLSHSIAVFILTRQVSLCGSWSITSGSWEQAACCICSWLLRKARQLPLTATSLLVAAAPPVYEVPFGLMLLADGFKSGFAPGSSLKSTAALAFLNDHSSLKFHCIAGKVTGSIYEFVCSILGTD